MQIPQNIPGGLPFNSTFDSIGAAAEQKKFSDRVNSLKDKASTALSAQEEDALKKRQELKEACQGFEAMFLDIMYREMKKTVPKDKLFGHSNAIEIFEEMRDTEIMKNMAARGGIGIADLMYQQLSPQIERQIEAMQKQKGATGE